jgi:CheY-like chemotaxis protein
MSATHDNESGEQSVPQRTFEEYDLPESLSVLIVEDDQPAQMLMEELLPSGYDVHVVAEADTARQMMTETNYDLVLVDIGLEGNEDGIELLQTMDADGYWTNTAAIAVTAYALPGDRRRIMDAGFDAYVSKPFTRDTFLTAIGDVLNAD